jgi:hypothetical protein
MANVGLADWDKSHELKALSTQYMEHPVQKKMNRKIAQLLLNPESAISSSSSMFLNIASRAQLLTRADISVNPKPLLPMFRIAYRRNPRFTGRHNSLETIHKLLVKEAPLNLKSSFVLVEWVKPRLR